MTTSPVVLPRADVAQNPLTRVEFRFPVGWKILNWAGLIFAFFYLLYVGNLARIIVSYSDRGWSTAVIQTSQETEVSVLWITIFLFSFPAFVAMIISGFKRLRQPLGFIERNKKGMFVACYTTGPLHLTSFGDWFSWGFADWTNLAPVGIVKRNFAEGLGLRFEDLDAFLASRQKLLRQDMIRHARLGPQWARLTISWINTTPLGKFFALAWTFQGLTKYWFKQQ